jgi:hypothetical protein
VFLEETLAAKSGEPCFNYHPSLRLHSLSLLFLLCVLTMRHVLARSIRLINLPIVFQEYLCLAAKTLAMSFRPILDWPHNFCVQVIL